MMMVVWCICVMLFVFLPKRRDDLWLAQIKRVEGDIPWEGVVFVLVSDNAVF